MDSATTPRPGHPDHPYLRLVPPTPKPRYDVRRRRGHRETPEEFAARCAAIRRAFGQHLRLVG